MLNAKATGTIAQHLQRVVVIDPTPASARLLADLLRNIGPCQIWTAATTAKGLALCRAIEPLLVFTEFSGPELNGMDFTKALRRSDMTCRQAPVIMITGVATAAAIKGARDSGVHEFLRKPYTVKDLLKRLDAVIVQPRDWVEGIGYIGPDRRRFNSGDYAGPRKRRSDEATGAVREQARILQAMKIVDAAVLAVDSDPAQAARALFAQAEALKAAAVACSDMNLLNAAVQFRKYLDQMTGALTQECLQTHADALWALLPAEAVSERAKAA
ncbi:MAG: response regulator [Caulobacteraceae bacterium]